MRDATSTPATMKYFLLAMLLCTTLALSSAAGTSYNFNYVINFKLLQNYTLTGNVNNNFSTKNFGNQILFNGCK